MSEKWGRKGIRNETHDCSSYKRILPFPSFAIKPTGQLVDPPHSLTLFPPYPLSDHLRSQPAQTQDRTFIPPRRRVCRAQRRGEGRGMEGFSEGHGKTGDEAGVRGRVGGGDFGEDVGCAGTDFSRRWLGGRGGLRRVGSEGYGEDDREEGREQLMHLFSFPFG